VSADNEFTLWINGKKVSEGDNFTVTVRAPIASFLRPGENVFAVAVANTGGEPNPAGWIGAFDLTYKDGSREVVKTDGKWSAGLDAQPGWEQTATKPGGWKDAQVLGAYAMAPWSRSGESHTLPPLYPSYELTATLFKGMGVPEDFTATGPVRYGHRRTNDRDIYFVANRTGDPIKADCRFRVGRGSPQLWDPTTGEQRPLPQFERADGLTSIPMEFDAFQSFFVVFGGKNEKPLSKTEKNFPQLKISHELTGAWEVAFDPKWGGPQKAEDRGQKAEDGKDGKIVFDKLVDWTTRSERGIKYYSGIATYRKNFSYQSSVTSKQSNDHGSRITDHSPVFLSLGMVHDMARVRLNGKDLGVVWCAPWRVDISGAVKAGDNRLEIEVVNRWANRMIGDRQPADANARTVKSPDGFLGGEEFKTGRYTFSTSDPYGAQSPLLPSGLLGPVRILTQFTETTK